MSQKKSGFQEEGRKHPRLNVQIWAVELNDNSRYFHMLSNLSMGGFFIEKKLPFPVGSIINFEIELDGEILPFRGKIVDNYESSTPDQSGAGVEFIEMDEKAKLKLEAYLKKLEKENPGIT